MYNKVIMMGRITKDLELKTTTSGVSVLSFSIAVDRRFSQNGEKVTDFFNVVAWRNSAEFIANYFHKGDAILIEGEMQTRVYEDKNGVQRMAYEIIVDRASFTGSKKSNNVEAGAVPVPSTAEPEEAESTEEYPF